MYREVYASAPRTPAFRGYDDGPVPDGQVRVVTEFGAPKHGTEMHLYRGHEQDRPWGRFPMALGNMFVGRVSELGRGVLGLAVGQRVAGYGALRPSHTVLAEHLRVMPERMTPQDAVCYDPAQFALAGVRDSHLRAGDTVAVFGLGAIGQMAVQICRLAGAAWIAAVDPLAIRREAASRTGASVVLDPARDDVPKALKDGSGGRGVDVVIETSASESALDTALAGLAYGGTVAYVGWPVRFSDGPDLGKAAHFNVPNLVFARACSEPNRDHPRWDFRRLCDTCWQWLADGRLDCATVVTPVVPFAAALQMYRDIDDHPEHSIKYGVRF